MKDRLAGLMRRFGQELIIIPAGPGEVRTARAFLQPVRKTRQDLPVTASPLGAVCDQRWLCLGPAGMELDPGDRVRSGELRLIVQEALTVRWGQDALYRRAVLRREKEAAV